MYEDATGAVSSDSEPHASHGQTLGDEVLSLPEDPPRTVTCVDYAGRQNGFSLHDSSAEKRLGKPGDLRRRNLSTGKGRVIFFRASATMRLRL